METPHLAPVPDLAYARNVLERFQPPDRRQRRVQGRMLAFVDEHQGDALVRTCRAGHLTASALVVDRAAGKALLTLHRKLGRWLQLGGHCDGDGNLLGVAWREVVEESGIEPIAITPAPVQLDIHVIPARAREPEHLHLDAQYLAFVPPGARAVASEESVELAWFSPEEARGIDLDPPVRRLFAIAFGE